MYRNHNYEEDFSQLMKNPKARKSYLLACLEDKNEPMSLEKALQLIINRMGTTEFSKLVGEKKQNVDKSTPEKENNIKNS